MDDDTMFSFNSQISQVFSLPGTDLYIAVADRWLPVTFTGGKPQICWYDSWRIEDFL